MIYRCCKPAQPAHEFASLAAGDTVLIMRKMNHPRWRGNPVRCECCGGITGYTPHEGLREEVGEDRVIRVRHRVSFHGAVHFHRVEAILANGLHYDLTKGRQVDNTTDLQDEQTGLVFDPGSTRITLLTTEETQ